MWVLRYLVGLLAVMLFCQFLFVALPVICIRDQLVGSKFPLWNNEFWPWQKGWFD
jgi:hypothetical protein